jgi:hypothetical protein
MSRYSVDTAMDADDIACFQIAGRKESRGVRGLKA